MQNFDQHLAIGAAIIPHPIIRWHNRLNINSPGFGTSLEVGNETIIARVGSAFSFTADTPSQSWSAGFSLNQLGKQLHYTYLNQGNITYKHLVSIGMSFGKQQPTSHKSETHTKTRQPDVETPTTIQSVAAKSRTQIEQPKQKPSKYKTVQIAEEYDVDVELLLAIVYAESNF